MNEIEQVKNEVNGNINKMPEPEVINYDVLLKLNDIFIDDLEEALGNYAYVETGEIIKAVNNMKSNMPINMLNEIIRRISSFPYKSVKKIMYNIETRQEMYWQIVKNN